MIKVRTRDSTYFRCFFFLALRFSVHLLGLFRFVFILSLFLLLLGACLFSNERENEMMWIWVGGEVERIWEVLGDKNHN